MELLRIDCLGFVLPVVECNALLLPRPNIILPILTLNTTRISIQFIDELQTLRQIVSA